jgi:hypothetical protein
VETMTNIETTDVCEGVWLGRGKNCVFQVATHLKNNSLVSTFTSHSHASLTVPHILNRSHTSYLPAYEDGTDSVPKRRHLNYRRRGIIQNKTNDILFCVCPLISHLLSFVIGVCTLLLLLLATWLLINQFNKQEIN